MRMESPLNQRLRRSPPDVVYTPIDVTSVSYDGGTTQNLTVNWTPTQWDVSAEVHSFQAVAGTNKGDHSPGGSSNKVTVEDIEVWGYGGHTYWESPPAITTPADEGNMETSSGGGSGTSYLIWDSRCS